MNEKAIVFHKDEKQYSPFQLPLLFNGMGMYELAAWHSYFRKREMRDKCKAIEEVVTSLPEFEKILIKKLKYFVP